MHQHIPAALFAGFNDIPLQFVAQRVARLDDASCRGQGYKGCGSDLCQLLDKKVGPVSPGQGGSDQKRKAQFPLRVARLRNIENHAPALHFDNSSGVFTAVAAKKANLLTGADAANCGKVMSFRAFQLRGSRLQRPIDVKPFRHPCYNTPPHESRRGARPVRTPDCALDSEDRLMSNSRPSEIADTTLSTTRQMLDELDALMERMLALPVNDLEGSPMPLPPPHFAAGLTPAEASRPMPLAEKLDSIKPVESMGGPPSKVLVGRLAELPASATPPSEPAPQKPSLKRLDLAEEPESQTSPAKEVLWSTEVSPPDLIMPPLPEKPSLPDIPLPPAGRLAGSTLWRPLLILNLVFDGITYLFGPLGAWLRTSAGRMTLGYVGLGLMAVAAAWWLHDLLGWTWVRDSLE
jgi:hypothetical protein